MKISAFSGRVMTALLCLAGLWSSVKAHHSTNMFDSDNPIELAGTVVEWQFSNPHTFIILSVMDDEGEETIWSLEGSSPNGLYRRGWTPDSLQPGDQIIVNVRPLRSGAPGGNFNTLRWEDGTPFDPAAPRPD